MLEVRLLHDRKIGLLTGVEFTLDEAPDLAAVCGYILTRSPEQLFVQASVEMLAEAKNEAMKKEYAQCGAQMLAGQRLGEREGSAMKTTFGVVNIGEFWLFMLR